jgi:hypothetical protein
VQLHGHVPDLVVTQAVNARARVRDPEPSEALLDVGHRAGQLVQLLGCLLEVLGEGSWSLATTSVP